KDSFSICNGEPPLFLSVSHSNALGGDAALKYVGVVYQRPIHGAMTAPSAGAGAPKLAGPQATQSSIPILMDQAAFENIGDDLRIIPGMRIRAHLRTKILLVKRFKGVKPTTERVNGVSRIERHPGLMIPLLESTAFPRPSKGDHTAISPRFSSRLVPDRLEFLRKASISSGP